MPKYGVHHIVLDRAIQRLGDTCPQAADILDAHQDIAMLGAIGPDLFFWAPDYPAIQVLLPVYTAFKTARDAYEAVVAPAKEIAEAIGDQVEELAPHTHELIEMAVNAIQENSAAFRAVLTTGALSAALGGVDLIADAAGLPRVLSSIFDQFRPPRQFGMSETIWFWFDMLHYRRTGDFARHLVELALDSSDEAQRAYAFGYLSHIATDLTGHPFVNQIVGGPFRLHVQRHAIVENFIDARAFLERYGESINLALMQRLQLPLPHKLPDEIVALIAETFRVTYTDPTARPDPFLTEEQIRETYGFFWEVLTLLEGAGVSRPTEPFPDVARVLEEAVADLLEPPPDPPIGPNSVCSAEDIFAFGLTEKSKACYDAFFEQIEEYFQYLGELMDWLFETLGDLVDLMAAGLTAIPVSSLLAVSYGIQLTLYDIWQALRSGLVLGGLVYPDPEDLNSSHGRNLTSLFQTCVTNQSEGYPLQYTQDVSHLVCPPQEVESPPTEPNFGVPGPDDVLEAFMFELPFDWEKLATYAEAPDPSDTRHLHQIQLRVGNAADLTRWMIEVASTGQVGSHQYLTAFTDFDLDADRGYFYRTWVGEITSDRVLNEAWHEPEPEPEPGPGGPGGPEKP